MLSVLNMPGPGIWQGCEYTRVTQAAECLNRPISALIIPQYA